MRTALSGLSLLEPKSLKEALKVLRDTRAIPMAGCTDIYVSLNFGQLKSTQFLNLWRLDSLRKIQADKEFLSIGSLATYTQIRKSGVVRKWLPMLQEAARVVGGVQIQNRGTIGGNIANGSPAGDTLPVLAAADAILVLADRDGTRRVPFNDFYTGYRKSVLRPDELIVSIEIPKIGGKQRFRKVGTRQAQAISKVVMAVVRNGKSPRIAIGSVGPTVMRLRRTERLLGEGGSIQDAQKVLLDEIRPIDDLRSTAAYRKEVAANLLASFWNPR